MSKEEKINKIIEMETELLRRFNENNLEECYEMVLKKYQKTMKYMTLYKIVTGEEWDDSNE